MMSRCASKTPASTWMSSFGNATSRLQKNLSFPNLDTAALGLLRLLQKRGEVRVAREQRKLAAILAADVVGYSRLMGRDHAGTGNAIAATRRRLHHRRMIGSSSFDRGGPKAHRAPHSPNSIAGDRRP